MSDLPSPKAPAPEVVSGPVTFGGDVGKLFAALARAQAKIGVAHKKANNPHFKSRYADLAEVWDAIQEALPPEGLCVIQMPHTDGARVSLTTMLGHESGAWISCAATANAKDNGPQAIGSVITYLRRYCGAAMAGVVQADDDGNAGQRGSQEAMRSPPPRPQPQPQPGNDVKSLTEYARDLMGAPPKPPTSSSEALPLVTPDGALRAIGPGKTAPAPVVWVAAWRKAIGMAEDAGALRVLRQQNGVHLASVSEQHPDAVAEVESLIERRMAELGSNDDGWPGPTTPALEEA